jgi:class 3 adenylate cyclase
MMDDDVGGIAVHIGARVASLAGAGEVLVSSTVKDLVAGSGLRFSDRGKQSLKGVPGEWNIFAVEP